jgi:feruloyl esterase
MRADTTLIASLLAASAAAQANYTGASNTTTVDNSYTNQKIVADLEAEVAALKHQIESAKAETCESSPVTGGSAASPAGSSPAGYSGVNKGTEGTDVAPAAAASSSAPAFYSGEDKPAGNTGAAGSSQSEKPAGYTGQTNTGSSSGDESSPAAGSSSGDESSPAAGSGSSGSSAGSSPDSYNGSNGGKVDQGGEYYAPNAPTDSKSTSTTTIIVTAGQTETVSQTQTVTATLSGASATGDVDVVTATETYCGKGPIPTAGSGSGSGSSAAGHASAALSSVISAGAGGAGKPSGYQSASSVISSTHGFFGNGTIPAGTGSGSIPTASSGLLTMTSGATGMTSSASIPMSTGLQGTGIQGTGVSSSAKPTATVEPKVSDCTTFCEQLTTFEGYEVTPETCNQLTAGVTYNTPAGQSAVSCGTAFTPEVDVCQVTLNVKTSGTANTYMEVWLPNGNATEWNGRSMNTDNGGLNGCVHYVDMVYTTGLGFASIGDNAGHNGSSFDGTWTLNNNEAIVDWAHRARHAAVEVGKETIDQFYSKPADYSYYVGCSAGGAQGVQSAEMYPNDFDGIIAGAAANDFNHLQGWSAHFAQLTGATGNDTFLSLADWTIVQTYVLEQCDAALDNVADGILEDPTQCKFDVSKIPTCAGEDDTTECLSATQKQTVEDVFKPLLGSDGNLIYPALFPGSQVDAFKLGLLNGKPQGIAQDWFRGAVFNSSSYDISKITIEDIELAQSQDELHGKPSAFSAQLGGFSDAGKKFIMYHGMADPMTSGGNAQRYYLKLAQEMGLSNTEIDNFFRLFRISGMAHCGVGGISGAGAWMFGQNGAAASATNNIVSNLVDWVENDNAPETLLGTKFWYDTPANGIMFERAHCRFPYRTTFKGADLDSTKPENWSCEMINDWQQCDGEFC